MAAAGAQKRGKGVQIGLVKEACHWCGSRYDTPYWAIDTLWVAGERTNNVWLCRTCHAERVQQLPPGAEECARLTALARTFPSLQGQSPDGFDPFDIQRLDEFLNARQGPPEQQQVGEFLLWLCDADDEQFDLRDALEIWDEAHRQAFTAWAINPWWPEEHFARIDT